jgi:hypothetical protein
MVQSLAILLGALYCFTWLRIPQDVVGQVLPAQRLVSWLGLLVICIVVLLGKPPSLNAQAKTYISAATLFLTYLLVDFVLRFVMSEGQLLTDGYFDLQSFISDFAKYLGSFSATFLVYFALKQQPEAERLFIRALLFSGTACIACTFLFLALYYSGFTTDNEVLAPTFGGVLGVWPTGGLLPRLAGTTAEPQQFSIVFITPLLLMLTKQYIRKFWPIAIASFAALLVCQSKFSLLSILFVVIYVFIIYKPYRSTIALVTMFTTPIMLYALASLPTFTQTLDEGLESGAIVDRVSGASELIFITLNYPINGIGAGQYASFVNWTVGFEVFPKNVYPNLDYLKILGETGCIGFLLMIFILWTLLSGFYKDLKHIPETAREKYFAVLLGGTVIIFSMFFSYEILHAIFWINVGYLIYIQESFSVEIEQSKRKQNVTVSELGGLPTAGLDLEN